MSAITGIFYRDGRKVDPEIIKKMNKLLSYRGPDGSNVYCDGPVALGHQMLYNTPESLNEKLPLVDDESGLIITADARIDNRKELSEKLGINDNDNVPDSYFILKSYEKWSNKCPDKLLGDFAFAIWNKNEESLFCAKDHMGIKPFYYYMSDELFVFSTEIKSILNISEVPCKLNKKKIGLYLMRDFLDQKLTFYKNIYSLPSAHSLLLSNVKTIKEKYWELNPNLSIVMGSEEDYAKAFQDIFSEAVKCRLRSNYPIGFELSGGLDSSSIVCMANKILLEPEINLKVINTFSIIYDKISKSDERDYIKKVLDKYDVNSNCLKGDDVNPLENIDTIFWYQDQPFFSPHTANQIQLYQEVNEKRIRVLLSGEGGDQVVSHGGNYLRELFFTFNWKKFIEELNGCSQNFKRSKYKIFLNDVIFSSLPHFIKNKIIKIIQRTDDDVILNKNFMKKLKIDKNDIGRFMDKIVMMKTKEYHYFSINNPLNSTIFGIVDRNTSRFNIEQRYPFYDKRLIEFCYSLPTDMKIKQGWDRYIMRVAMKDILPPEIQWRPRKGDLSNVYRRNLMLFEKDTIKKILYEDNEVIKNYVDIGTVQTIFKQFESGKRDRLFDVWLVVLLYFWIKFRKNKD